MSLLRRGGELFRLARRETDRFKDTQVAEVTRSWLTKAEELRSERHEVVHSIVLHRARAGLTAYHPRSGTTVIRSTREVMDLASAAERHASDGNYMSLFTWPEALDE